MGEDRKLEPLFSHDHYLYELQLKDPNSTFRKTPREREFLKKALAKRGEEALWPARELFGKERIQEVQSQLHPWDPLQNVPACHNLSVYINLDHHGAWDEIILRTRESTFPGLFRQNLLSAPACTWPFISLGSRNKTNTGDPVNLMTGRIGFRPKFLIECHPIPPGIMYTLVFGNVMTVTGDALPIGPHAEHCTKSEYGERPMVEGAKCKGTFLLAPIFLDTSCCYRFQYNRRFRVPIMQRSRNSFKLNLARRKVNVTKSSIQDGLCWPGILAPCYDPRVETSDATPWSLGRMS
ncbi:hypothetical protein VNO77_37666 [Canavalia gladiata]|uniref:Uncharacterized protein n=1 Tax=Canavalia gladiata TaxID=3824 RepID=A0AAN9KB28_CANGL